MIQPLEEILKDFITIDVEKKAIDILLTVCYVATYIFLCTIRNLVSKYLINNNNVLFSKKKQRKR